MSCALYMDVHVPLVISEELRHRGVEVLTAQEDGNRRLPDPALLMRATFLDRALFTQDKHFLAEGARLQRAHIDFAGVIFAGQLKVTIGSCIADLEVIGLLMQPEELQNNVFYLPL